MLTSRIAKKNTSRVIEEYYKAKKRYENIELHIKHRKKYIKTHMKNLKKIQKCGQSVSIKSWELEKENEQREMENAIIKGGVEFPEDYRSEIEYLRSRGRLELFPYCFIESYYEKQNGIEVFWDKGKQLKYVVDNGKRLYFPQNSDEEIVNDYVQLLLEQDPRSPHAYFSDNVNFEGGIFVDVGSAEGIISLHVVEKADEIYLIECSPKWIEALGATFEEYKDKIHIIPKLASLIDDSNFVSLDKLLEKYEERSIFIKMDVEGMEMDVLGGCTEVMRRNKCRFSCTTYHTNSMEERIKRFFNENKYYYEVSE